MPRSLSTIARDIRVDAVASGWEKSPSHIYARPYLSAMAYLDKITDSFYEDSGRSVVAYFLANASTWRGPTARRIKAELKEMLK